MLQEVAPEFLQVLDVACIERHPQRAHVREFLVCCEQTPLQTRHHRLSKYILISSQLLFPCVRALGQHGADPLGLAGGKRFSRILPCGGNYLIDGFHSRRPFPREVPYFLVILQEKTSRCTYDGVRTRFGLARAHGGVGCDCVIADGKAPRRNATWGLAHHQGSRVQPFGRDEKVSPVAWPCPFPF